MRTVRRTSHGIPLLTFLFRDEILGAVTHAAGRVAGGKSVPLTLFGGWFFSVVFGIYPLEIAILSSSSNNFLSCISKVTSAPLEDSPLLSNETGGFGFFLTSQRGFFLFQLKNTPT